MEIGALHDEMLDLLERPEEYVRRFKTAYQTILGDALPGLRDRLHETEPSESFPVR